MHEVEQGYERLLKSQTCPVRLARTQGTLRSRDCCRDSSAHHLPCQLVITCLSFGGILFRCCTPWALLRTWPSLRQIRASPTTSGRSRRHAPRCKVMQQLAGLISLMDALGTSAVGTQTLKRLLQQMQGFQHRHLLSTTLDPLAAKVLEEAWSWWSSTETWPSENKTFPVQVWCGVRKLNCKLCHLLKTAARSAACPLSEIDAPVRVPS